MEANFYKAILIDSLNREIREIQIPKNDSLRTLQSHIGGLITPGHHLLNDDLVYVNDEGWFKGSQDFFFIKGAPQPFAGNGVIVAGNEYEDALSKLDQIKKSVRFLSSIELKIFMSLRDNHEEK